MKTILVITSIISSVLFASTYNVEQIKKELIEQGYKMPKDIKDLPYTLIVPVKNTEAAIEVGALLYSDNSLSLFGQTSCAASCHKIDNHLAPKGAQIGTGGVWGKEGRQRLKYFPETLELDEPAINAPQAENSIYTKRVLHDCSQTVQTQPSQDVGSFAHNIDWTAIKEDDIYKHYFNIAYGSPVVNEQRFIQSLSIFQESHVSNQTPFQKWLRGEYQLTELQSEAVSLMFGKYKCQSCHSGAGLNGEGLKMAAPVKQRDFFKKDVVNTRSLYNMDAFEKYGWGGDYKTLGRFDKKHYEVIGLGVSKRERKIIRKYGLKQLMCD